MWKVYDVSAGDPARLIGVSTPGVTVEWEVEVKKINGADRAVSPEKCKQFQVTLHETPGDHSYLLKLKERTAGTKLKLTLEVPVAQEDGTVQPTDVLDVNLTDLARQEFSVFDDGISLVLVTEADPEFKLLTGK